MMRSAAVVASAKREGNGVDTEFVEDLYAKRGQALFGLARSLGLTDDEAADALQETLTRLLREVVRGNQPPDPAGWCFRTIYRISMDDHRLRRRIGRLRDRLVWRGATSTVAAADEDQLTVWAEVDRLPQRQRQALYLRYRADLPFDEVAAVLMVTPGAARMLVSRALDRVRHELAEPGGE